MAASWSDTSPSPSMGWTGEVGSVSCSNLDAGYSEAAQAVEVVGRTLSLVLFKGWVAVNWLTGIAGCSTAMSLVPVNRLVIIITGN